MVTPPVRMMLLSVMSVAAAQFAVLTDFKLIRVLELKAPTQHVQGIDFNDRQLWVTSVDKPNQKGWLQEFSRDTGDLTRQVEIGEGKRFHPGGLSADGPSLWIPVAEYRAKSSSMIQKRSKLTLQVEFQFEVADHIGCIAVTPEFLIGGNWDSKEFYIWDHRGKLIRKAANPTDNGYQDMKFDANQIVASGILADKTGAIDWLDFPSLRLSRRVKAGNNDRGVLYTREGMAIRGNQLMLLPEDAPSRVFVFDLRGR
jgi:Family of unknown function (DUF6454)